MYCGGRGFSQKLSTLVHKEWSTENGSVLLGQMHTKKEREVFSGLAIFFWPCLPALELANSLVNMKNLTLARDHKVLYNPKSVITAKSYFKKYFTIAD